MPYEATMNEIDANSNRPDGVYGVPTSFIEFDELTGGLHPGQMIVIAARPGVASLRWLLILRGLQRFTITSAPYFSRWR